MKNLKNVAILLVMFAIISCGNSIESDAQKLVKLQCKAQKLAKKAMSGDIDQIERGIKFSNGSCKIWRKSKKQV